MTANVQIVDHKWFCIRCCKVWTLSVNIFDPKDRQLLDTAYTLATKHVLTNSSDDRNHEIIHKEKIRGFEPRRVV